MFQTIETTVKIETDGQLILQLPPHISPGLHRVMLVIEAQPPAPRWVEFPTINVAYWPSNFSLRREEM